MLPSSGLLANVNRWRGQIGLEPVTEKDLEAIVQPLDLNGTKASLVDMTGAEPGSGKPSRTVVAMAAKAGRTWFYKMSGDVPVVEKEKETFINWVRKVT